MTRVILQISYEIDPLKREEYLNLIRQIREHFTQVRKKNYSVFEVKGKKNAFIEQFLCESMEEYDALEDDLDERSEELVNRLESLLGDGKARYTTLIETD